MLRSLAVLFLALLLNGCAYFGFEEDPDLQEPANLGDLKQELLAYKYYSAYERDIAAVDIEAQLFIEQRASMVTKPALVLDIDETSLSNWPEIVANDFARVAEGPCNRLPKGPCGVKAWQKLAIDEAIEPTLSVFKIARSHGVAVFFITGRDESLRAATEKNLRAAGYSGWVKLIMRPAGTTTPSAADYKAPEREKIEDAGYTIIANIGDQPSDLAGGFAERTYKLPDPFYRIP